MFEITKKYETDFKRNGRKFMVVVNASIEALVYVGYIAT